MYTIKEILDILSFYNRSDEVHINENEIDIFRNDKWFDTIKNKKKQEQEDYD